MLSPRSPALVVAAVIALLVAVCDGQAFYHHTPFGSGGLGHGFAYHTPTLTAAAAAPAPRYESPLSATPQYGHPSVVANALRESELPPELLKSTRFYGQPRIATGLAKSSWLTDQESIVTDREAEKVPRDMIFKIFRNAGWIKRR